MRNAKLDALCWHLNGMGLNDIRVRTRKAKVFEGRKRMAFHLLENTNMGHRTIAEIVGWNGDNSMISYILRNR
jgi:hypothetical protein